MFENVSTPPLNNVWPPKSINHHIFCSRGDILMKLVAEYRFLHMTNSTKYIKLTSDMSKWVNPRWPTIWLQKSVNGYNFCSSPDNLMKIVAKYRFSSIRNSIRHMESTLDMCKWVKIQDGYH